jgi:hypothetical protein
MRFISLITLMLLTLPACSPALQGNGFKPPDTPGGQLCVEQCAEAKNYCEKDCGLAQRSCVKDVQTQALLDYDAYTRQQFQAGQPIELRPRDFERMNRCDDAKKQCSGRCEDKYVSCYKTCGGVVETAPPCQFLCF